MAADTVADVEEASLTGPQKDDSCRRKGVKSETAPKTRAAPRNHFDKLPDELMALVFSRIDTPCKMR